MLYGVELPPHSAVRCGLLDDASFPPKSGGSCIVKNPVTAHESGNGVLSIQLGLVAWTILSISSSARWNLIPEKAG
jgi:hypothetical protein